ncbi:MAG: GNAT family N-acetyltransferase [Cyclobacteriaceae bacterium]|nr:GNAT family N-acetyltransferase [Cyclobacteriaceae bacterium]
MENIEIRKITIKDIDQLLKIGKQTFIETYSSDNTEKNMKKYMEEGFSTKKMKTELTDKNAEFYFAEFEGNVIGYLKLNVRLSQTVQVNENALEVERIYVLKDFHRKKIGQLLIEKAIEVSEQRKVDFIWVGVWEKNPRAIQFYEKNGFVEFDKHKFNLGDDEQIDIMMKMKLN